MAAALVTQLKNEVDGGNFEAAKTTLLKFKIALTSLESLPPVSISTPNAAAELRIAREGLQQAVLVSLGLHDKEGFARHISQLKPMYSTADIFQANDAMSLAMGLQLMFLLVENRLAEFHSELELLTDEERQIEAIAFPSKLEQFMMVGAFNKVLAAKASVPSATFEFFMGSIVETVRGSITECAQAAYSSLSLDSAQEMLMLDTRAELKDFITHQGWVASGETISFHAQEDTMVKSALVPSERLLSESLAYATELERIV